MSAGQAWNEVRKAIEQPWGNGRWASYKTVEILQKVHGWPLVAPDMGNDGSSGPRQTLARLYDLPSGDSKAAVAAADAAGVDLQKRLAEAGVRLEIEEVETVLCDFGNVMKGKFYVGHDIDGMAEAIMHPSVPPEVRERLFTARKVTLPHEYLGELKGWDGIDDELGRRYLLTGEVGDRGWARGARVEPKR